jgi:pantothenate kinase
MLTALHKKPLKGFQSTYHTESLFTKSLKGFQSTYNWKLFTKVIKRISVNRPLDNDLCEKLSVWYDD